VRPDLLETVGALGHCGTARPGHDPRHLAAASGAGPPRARLRRVTFISTLCIRRLQRIMRFGTVQEIWPASRP